MNPRREVAIGQRAVALGWLHPEHARACFQQAQRRGSTILDEALRAGLLSPEQARALDPTRNEAPGPALGSEDQGKKPQPRPGGFAPRGRLPELGQEVGGYRLQKLLGQGGMGAVFVAEKFGKRAALKLITIEDENALERFHREAQAVAAVDKHPNIVGVHSYDRDGPTPFLVLELIEGQGLDQRLAKQGPPPLEQALTWIIAVAEAVDFIHRRGLLHRDLKPANILIRDRDQAPMVTDFGLVRGGISDGLTQSTEVLGTPSYMSPEQASSENERVGPAADIWALGVILYELTTGARPFVASGPMQLLNKIIFKDPPPLRQHKRELPADLETIILRALRKEPAERYQSAEELAEDCRRLLEGEPLAAASETFDHRAWRRARRRLGKRALFALVGLAIATALVAASLPFLGLLQDSKKRFEDRIAEADRRLNEAAGSAELGYGLLPSMILRAAPPFERDEVLELETPRFPAEVSVAFEAAESLRDEAEAAGRLGSFERVISAKKWRRHQLSLRLLDSLAAPAAEAPGGDVGRFVRGLQELRAGDDKAIATWESIRDGELAAFARLGVALAHLGRRRWSTALAILKSCSNSIHPSLAEAARRLEVRARESFALASILAPEAERNERFQALIATRDSLKDPSWQRWQDKLAAHLKRAIGSQESAATVSALEAVGNQVPGFPEPDIPAELFAAACRAALARKRLGLGIRYGNQARARDPGIDLPTAIGRVALIQLLTDSLLRGDFEKSYELVLEVSRIGIFLDVRREADLVFLDEGLLDRELKRAPLDPCAQYWRAAVRDLDKRIETHPSWSPEKKRRELKRLDEDKALRTEKILANPRANKTLKALALSEHAAALRRLSFDDSAVSPEGREAARERVRAELEQALALGAHPKPYEVFESLARLEYSGRDDSLFKDAIAMERLLKTCERWQACVERWRAIGKENREFDEGLAVYFEEIDNRHIYRILRKRCVLLNALGRHPAAEAAAAAALRMEREALAGVFEPYPKLEVTAPRELVLSLARQGRWPEAEAEGRRALGEGRDPRLRRALLAIWESEGREPPAGFAR